MTFEPVYELTRGNIIESIHFGAAAVVDSFGNLLFSRGDPGLVCFLRSSAKPFQALPFIMKKGHIKYQLGLEEIALMCSSHSGTPEHTSLLAKFQKKIGITVEDLKCGAHYPIHGPSADQLLIAGLEPDPSHHNCSGKHTGLIAHALMNGDPTENYIDLEHPVQQNILKTFANLCNIEIDEVELGIDGCSAPNFAVPLYNTALAYARLCDPHDLDVTTAEACDTITQAMTTHPFIIAGPERFDTVLMIEGKGAIVAKGGAEGFMTVGIKPSVLYENSPGVGIAIKISDGDISGRARSGFTLQILDSLGLITTEMTQKLANFGPNLKLFNYREIEVGKGLPASPVEISWK